MSTNAADARPTWRHRLRRHRRTLALVALALLVGARLALPTILRRVLVTQMNAALAGRTEIGDVDLWLFRGAVALRDVALHADGAAAADPPLVVFRRLYANVGWFPFFRHTVRIEEVALDGLVLDLSRLKDGALILPALRESGAPPAPAPPPEPAPSGTPWSVVIEQAALRDGHLRLRDHVVDPPETAELGLDGLRISGLSFQYGPDAAPGHAVIEVSLGDGTVRIDTTITTRAEGFALIAIVDVTNLPLDRTQRHVPQLGWVGFAGRLDSHLALRAEPGATPVTSGALTLRDLQVNVAGVEGPALAWKRLDVELETLDLTQRTALVKRVALDSAGVVLRPRNPVLLPLLEGLLGAPPDAKPAPSAPALPWTWRVDALEITDSGATVVLDPPPLEIQIAKATVTGLASEAGAEATVALELHEGEGTLALDGTVRLDPPGAQLRVRLDRLDVGRFVAAVGGVPVAIPRGVLGGTLTVAAEHEPLRVSGELALADLQVATPSGEDFALGWKRLELGIREVRIPGVLPGAPAGAHEPLHIDLERLRLVAPSAALTRTSAGLVLPAAGPPAPAGEPAPAAEAAAPPAAGPGPTLVLGRLDVEGGQVTVLDRTVKPFYRGKVSAITLRARGLRYPENVFEEFAFAAQMPGNAPVRLTGKRGAAGVEIEGTAEGLPLAQFNPYVTQAAGYSIGGGTGTLGATVRLDAEHYESTSTLRFDQLHVAGAEGDSLFAQRFGIPLTMALGLMKDLHGVIALTVPVTGDRSGTHVDLGAIVGEALTRALLGAITSPLKLLGAVALSGDKVASVAPEPIGFAAGRVEVADDAWWRIEQLTNVLASYPGLRVELQGSAGGGDVRALQDAAVLASLRQDQGMLGTLRTLPARAERNAIRDALAAGTPDALPPERRQTLDAWASAHAVSDAELRALAEARAARLQVLLAQDYGVDGGRLAVGEPGVDRNQGPPAVRLSLR